MIRRRRANAVRDGFPELLTGTERLVDELVRELRSLRTENARLSREVDRLARGWEQIRALARSAPRRPRG